MPQGAQALTVKFAPCVCVAPCVATKPGQSEAPARVPVQRRLPASARHSVNNAGYPGRHQLSWKTRLHKGQNVLELPVQALDEGRGELRTQLTYKDKVKTYQFVLDAKGPDTKNF